MHILQVEHRKISCEICEILQKKLVENYVILFANLPSMFKIISQIHPHHYQQEKLQKFMETRSKYVFLAVALGDLRSYPINFRIPCNLSIEGNIICKTLAKNPHNLLRKLTQKLGIFLLRKIIS